LIATRAFSKALPNDLGYMQSKAVGEKLMWQAIGRGIPVSIHRVGFILWHSQSGAGSVEQMWARLVKDCVAIKSFPRFSDLKEEFVTVDYACQAITRISQQSDCVGKAFHIVPDQKNNITTDMLFNLIGKLGYPLEGESLPVWRKRLQLHTREGHSSDLELLKQLFNDPIHDLLTFFELYQFSPNYSSTNTAAALKGSDIAYTPIDCDILKRYLEYLLAVHSRTEDRLDDTSLLQSNPIS